MDDVTAHASMYEHGSAHGGPDTPPGWGASLAPLAQKMPCTVRQLQVFAAAAKDCHFGRTAHRLGISQPAITKQIAALEDRIGLRLFVRGRGVAPALTPEGEAFLERANRFLMEGDAVSASRVIPPGSNRGHVRIASGPHILADYIKPWLPSFAQRHPAIRVSCELVDAPGRGLDLLDSGAADVVLHTALRPKPLGFTCFVLRPIRVAIFGAPRFAAHRDAGADEIAALPFILPAEGTEGERVVRAILSDAGVTTPNVVLRVQYYEVLKQLVAEGCGVAAMFETMAEQHVRRGEMFELSHKLPNAYRVLYRRDRVASGALAAVESSLLTVLQH